MAGGDFKKDIDGAIATIADRLDCILLDYYQDPPTKQKTGPQRYLFPTGAYALGLWSPDDEVHLVALTDNTAKIFWSFVAEKLDLEVLPESVHAQAKHELEDRIWLHYCAMPKGFDLATVSGYGFPEYSRDAFQPSAVRRNLDMLRDTKRLLDECSAKLETFRAVYGKLRQWAQDAGLWSHEFGLLTPDTLIWLIYSSAEWLQNPQIDPEEAVGQCLTRLQDPSELASLTTPSERPASPAPDGLSADSRAAIANAASIAVHTPSALSGEDYFARFLETGRLVRIQAWCFSSKEIARFQVELVRLAASLRGRLEEAGQPISRLQIWPHAFRSSETDWMYLVSVDGRCESEAIEQIGAALLEHLDGMGGITVEMLERGMRRDLLQHADEMSYQASRRFNRSRFEQSDVTKAHQSPCTAASALSLITSANGKQPSAAQVLSRLRWDPAYANESYEVGYLDRFEGIKWLPLEMWGKATEEEDFVPEHRIRVFRKVGAGKEGVVWERIGREGRLWSG